MRVKGDGKGRQGGRQKGTPNKMTKEVRGMIQKFVELKWGDFIDAYDHIEKPADKCYIMTSLLPFIAPKMASVEYKGDAPAMTFKDELDEISGEITRK